MSKILLYQEATTGVTTNGEQHAFFIDENGIPTVKHGSSIIQFSTSGYAFAGSSGSSGISGTNGSSGSNGVSGTSGVDGASGLDGSAGTSGINGTSGVDGSIGLTGDSGSSGSSGLTGSSGSSGLSYGSSGTSGAMGSTGASGTSGSSGANGSDGVGIPDGGTTGQVLAKASNADFDTEWVNQSGGGGGDPGLVNGTGVNSLKSATHLTTTPAVASGTNGIAFGESAKAYGVNDIAIGSNIETGDVNNPNATFSNIHIGDNIGGGYAENMIKIGKNIPAKSFNYNQIFLGDCSTIGGRDNVIIGWQQPKAYGDDNVAVGNGAEAGQKDVAVGRLARAIGGDGFAAGYNAVSNGLRAIAIGRDASASAQDAINIGKGGVSSGLSSIKLGKDANASATTAIAIGFESNATVDGAVALGGQVTASKENTASVKALETQTPSTPSAGGIIMKDAGSTERRLNITAAGGLQIDNTPVGGGGGGLTPPMSLLSLPPIATNVFGITSTWKTWVATTGYGRQPVSIDSTVGRWSVFQMGEGSVIRSIRFFVNTAVAGSTCWVGIYRLGTDADGNLIMTDRLVDCGTVSSETTGYKTINLGTTFTMAAETYGAVGIVVGGSTSGINISLWNSPVWSGNGGIDTGDGTFYRANSLSLNYSSTSTAPASLANGQYITDTSGALFIFTR